MSSAPKISLVNKILGIFFHLFHQIKAKAWEGEHRGFKLSIRGQVWSVWKSKRLQVFICNIDNDISCSMLIFGRKLVNYLISTLKNIMNCFRWDLWSIYKNVFYVDHQSSEQIRVLNRQQNINSNSYMKTANTYESSDIMHNEQCCFRIAHFQTVQLKQSVCKSVIVWWCQLPQMEKVH